MNPIIKDQINSLRKPGVSLESLACAVASSMEMLMGQNETLDNIENRLEGVENRLGSVEVQTTKTNGQVIDLKKCRDDHAVRIQAIEIPATEIKTVYKAAAKVAAVISVGVGVVAGGVSTVGSLSKPNPDEIKAAVEAALKEAAKKPTP